MKLRPNGKYSAIQKCECGAKVEPLMVIGNEPDDWVWEMCFACDEIVCPECKCAHDGEIYCTTCYGGIALQNNTDDSAKEFINHLVEDYQKNPTYLAEEMKEKQNEHKIL